MSQKNPCSDYLSCPNCGAVWGMEEIDFQECWACGYPEHEQDGDDDWPEVEDLLADPSGPYAMGPGH